MKILLYLTNHRQIEEFKLYAQFAEKCCPKLTAMADLFVHCNNLTDAPKIMEAFNHLPHKNKDIVFVTQNCGYKVGPIEQLAWGYEHNIFKGYDFVIHSHIDVFMTTDTVILDILQKTKDMNVGMLVTRSWPDREWFDTDVLIFKPDMLPFNIFLLYKTFEGVSEEIIVEQIKRYQIPTALIPRYNNNTCFPRRIDDYLKFWHEHDLEKVRRYLEQLITTAPTTPLTSPST